MSSSQTYKDIDKSNVLSSIIKNKRIPHAVLFDGGNAKTRLKQAMELARFAVCSEKNFWPCGKCKSCKKFNENSHPDVKIFDQASKESSLRIDLIREIRKDAYIISNESEYKVYIINNAEKMTTQASNAILKILEEPPQGVIFILTCESSLSLLETIRSRCVIVSLNIEGNEKIAKKVKDSAESVLQALINKSEWELMSATAKFTKDKFLFQESLKELSRALMNSLYCSYGVEYIGEENETIRALAKSLTKKNILDLIDEISKFNEMLSHNTNTSLLASYFCSRLIITLSL